MSRSSMIALMLIPFLLTVIAGLAPAQNAPIDNFIADVERREEALKPMNLDFYESVELTGAREATVTVTPQWMQYVTPVDNQGNINSLFDAWRFSHGSNATGVTLIVLDPDGNVIRTVTN